MSLKLNVGKDIKLNVGKSIIREMKNNIDPNLMWTLQSLSIQIKNNEEQINLVLFITLYFSAGHTSINKRLYPFFFYPNRSAIKKAMTGKRLNTAAPEVADV